MSKAPMGEFDREETITNMAHLIFLQYCTSSACERMQVSHVRDLANDAAETAFDFMVNGRKDL